MPTIPVIVMASISCYVGIYHLLIDLRRRQIREHLVFSLLCFTVVTYDIACIGLYNSTSVFEGAQWQRAQFVALAMFVPAFLWFVSIYTNQKRGAAVYAYTLFYVIAFLIQLFDRSDLTLLMDQPSIKQTTFARVSITYYEAAFGVFSSIQSVMGLVASTYILVMVFRFYKGGHKREAIPLFIATGLMYAAGVNDTLVGNGVYQSIYLMEYAYLATIIMMTSSLSSTVVEAAIAKEELKKSEEWFRSLVETTSDWVWEVDTQGRYTYASPRVRDLLGYEPEEVLGHAPFDFMWPEDSQVVRKTFESIIQNRGVLERVENINVRKDGQTVVLETSGIPFFDDQGELLGYRGIDRDITARKKAENALRESEEKFRSIVEHSLSGIFKVDNSFHFVYVNDELCRILGYPRNELLGLDFRKVLSDNSRDLVADRYTRRQRGELVPSHYELEIIRRNGELRTAEMIVNMINPGTPTPSTMGQLIDITERRQIENKLRDSEERLQQAVRISNIGIFDHDQINEQVYWSPLVRKHFGLSPAETYSLQDFVSQLHPDDVERTLLAIRRAHDPAGDGSYDVEYRFIRRDGQIRWFAAKSQTFFDGQGDQKRPVRTIGALMDITERKQIEEEREKLIRELEAKNAELERFTYTVSHDLKSPLVTIKGFLGFLKQDFTSQNSERFFSDVDRIGNATTKMDLLLRDLLELSRIGRLINPSEDIPFASIVQEAMEMVHGQLDARKVLVHIEEDLPVVYVDRRRLVEVLQNLIDNATKFMGDRPDPQIEIGQFGSNAKNPIFYVKDNGIGFAPEYREHVFGLFNKLDPKTEGSGIGLALVKRIVEMHGGRIWVESEKGKGSTFYFTLAKDDPKLH